MLEAEKPFTKPSNFTAREGLTHEAMYTKFTYPSHTENVTMALALGLFILVCKMNFLSTAAPPPKQELFSGKPWPW